MLDRHLRPLIDPPLNAAGAALARAGMGANVVTGAGLVAGLAAAIAITLGWYGAALALIGVSRLADGLDGAVARATQPSDFGGYLDIVADFIFYAAVPLAFAVADPQANGIAAAALIAAFYVNGASFLGYSILAAKHSMTTRARGRKSWYHSGGLLEGSETIAFFVAFCLVPDWFAPIAWLFALLCLATTVLRIVEARNRFGDQG